MLDDKAGVPQLRGDDSDMTARRHVMWDGVEVPVAIAPKEDCLGLEILNRKTRSIKLLNRTVIVASKLSNR
jgi:hypothetical protein